MSSGGGTLWPSGGVLVETPFQTDPPQAGAQHLPRLVSDLVGGVVIPAQDKGGYSIDITGNRLDENHRQHWARWIFYDSHSPTDPGVDQIDPWIVYDGSGPAPKGTIAIWKDQPSGELYAQKVEIGPPDNDPCAAAVVAGLGQTEGSTIGSTQDGSATRGGTSEVWFTFTAPSPGTLFATTCGTHDLYGMDTGMDTVLSVHAACPGTWGNELPGGCNDDWPYSYDPSACSGSDLGTLRDSAVSVGLASGQTVMIRIARYGSLPNDRFLLNLEFAVAACGRVPDQPMWHGTPLTIDKEEGRLVLTWGPSCLTTDDDYGVYEGLLPDFYSHEWIVCSTGGETRAELMPPEPSSYYLVVPRRGGMEGSYGTKLPFEERPRGRPACTEVQSIGSCP